MLVHKPHWKYVIHYSKASQSKSNMCSYFMMLILYSKYLSSWNEKQHIISSQLHHICVKYLSSRNEKEHTISSQLHHVCMCLCLAESKVCIFADKSLVASQAMLSSHVHNTELFQHYHTWR